MKLFSVILPLLLLMLCIDSGCCGKKREDPNRSVEKVYDDTTATKATKGSATTPSSKPTEKLSYPKKVTSLKKRPSKSSKSSTVATKKQMELADTFKDLPADDLEFIKELDKQFKQHGDKIKIKVERENITDTKNSKRTIEGELGYGAYHNGYEYARPKFMFYPYSQSDIPAEAPGYYAQYEKTSVTIEPSYSYELKPQTYVEQQPEPQVDLPHPEEEQQQQDHHQQQQPQQQQYDEPVIVLRIPGPAKYASHLQTLLQQYLEIRAAQYLRILEEAELRKQQHQQPQPEQYEHPSLAGGHQSQQLATDDGEEQQQQHYQQEITYAHQMAPTPQPVQYPAIDEVYQSYKSRPQQQQQHQQHYQPETVNYYTENVASSYQSGHLQHQHQQQQQQIEEEPQYYYMPQQQQQYVQTPSHGEHSYQNVYFIAMNPQSNVYAHPQQQQQQQQQQYYEDTSTSGEQQHMLSQPITENNPRSSHTKVVFAPHQHDAADSDYSSMYPLPSIRPYERHAPTSTPLYQQHDYQPHAAETATAEQDAAMEHGNTQNDDNSQRETVAITQRPFNYHAHVVQQQRLRQRQAAGHSKRGATASPVIAAEGSVIAERTATVPAQKADQQLEQIRDYVRHKLGAQTGSSVEFKTTKVVKA